MRRIFKKTLCGVMASVMLLSAIPALGVSAAQTGSTDDYSVDFSDPESEYNLTVSPSEIISGLYTNVSATEAKYLDEYFEAAFIYSPEISADHVSVTVYGGNLKVSAKQKKYTAANGQTVVWTPVSVKYADTDYSLDMNHECELTAVSGKDIAYVKYTCILHLPESYVSDISNFARDQAIRGAEIASVHEDALSGYLKALESYQTYLSKLDEYENALDAYEEYKENLAIYNSSLKEYNAYLSALDSYEKALAKYNAYLTEYDAYLTAKQEYEQAYAENKAEYERYHKYLENLSKIRSSMAYIESLFVTPSNGVRCLYDALQNKELVSMIEKYDDELVNLYGVKRSDIDDMRSVSDELNSLLHGYSDARDISEEQAFAYYKAHYSEISEKFKYLYHKMTAILTPTIFNHICAYIEIEYKSDESMATYKKWRVLNVLCHIYLICRGLDDTVTADSTWSFYLQNGTEHVYNFSELLGQNVILTDTDSACPDSLEWWSGDIPAQDLPTAPTMPTQVLEPVKPMEVSEPTKPTAVIDPGDPPHEVTAPGTRPTIEDYDLVLRTQQYFGDTIPEERDPIENAAVTLEQTVARPFTESGTLKVYYNYDGGILSVGVEPSDTPVREETAECKYTFEQWREIQADNGDKLYYADYSGEKQTYTVTFKLLSDSEDAWLVLNSIEYGATPEYSETPTKGATERYEYAFAGWYPTLSAVKGDTEYIAQFTETERLYEISFSVLGQTTTKYLTYGAEPVAPSIRSEQYIGGTYYKFTGWDKQISPVTKSTTYTAEFEETSLAKLPDGTEKGLAIYDSGTSLVLSMESETAQISGLLSSAYTLGRGVTVVTEGFTLRLDTEAIASLRAQGANSFTAISSENRVGFTFTRTDSSEVYFSGGVQMSIPHGLLSTDGMFIDAISVGGARSELSCSEDGDLAVFSARTSTYYKADRYFSLKLEVGENGAAFADSYYYRVGQEVEIKLLPNGEYTVSKLELVDSQGNAVDITGQTSFTMPSDNVTVRAEFAQRMYTVRFICNGETVSEELYLLGDTIAVPDIALSFELDGFLYSFIGWSETVSIVTGDHTFTAKYLSVRLDLIKEADTQSAVNKVVTSLVLPIIGAVLLVCGAAAGITVLLVIRKRKKKENDTEHKESEVTDEGEDKQ